MGDKILITKKEYINLQERLKKLGGLRGVETELESRYVLLSSLINNAGDMIIFSLDKDYRYKAFNEKHLSEMKKVWNADIRVGINFLEYMHIPELKDRTRKSIDRALRGEAFTEIIHQSEPDIYYESSWYPVVQNEKVIGVTAYTRDITGRMHIEEDLKKSADEICLPSVVIFIQLLYLRAMNPEKSVTSSVFHATSRSVNAWRMSSIGSTPSLNNG